MNKYKIIILLICGINLQAQGQTKNSSFINKTEFKIGYYGNLLYNNGINIGAEYLLGEKKKEKQHNDLQKITTHQLLLNGSIGYSTNFANQTDNGLSMHYGIIYRRTNSKGRQFNLEFNPLGYYRSFLPETFEVKDGEVSKVGFPGRSYYAPSLSIGFGKLRKGKTRSGRYCNLNIALRTPHNGWFLPHISFQYGQRFNFKKKK